MEIKKNIVIWGCGIEGEKFYWSWRHKVNIVYAIDTNYQFLQKFHEIEVYGPQKVDILKRHYIVICADDEDNEKGIIKELKRLGLVEFENYILANLYGDKKLAVLYGNCHMIAIESYLRSNVHFAYQYSTRLYYVNDMDGECFPSDAAMKNCDLFIAQDINEQNRKGLPSAFKLKNMLVKDSKSIIIPNLYGMNLYFPQYTKGKFGHAFKTHFKDLHVEAGGRRRQELLRSMEHCNEIIDSNMDKKYLDNTYKYGLQIISDPNTYNPQEIIDNVQTEIRKLEEREKLCDIVISDFICQNFRKQKLFYEPYHPSGVVFREKGRRILESIGIQSEIADIPLEEMDFRELPVYISVQKALSLEFDQDYIRKSQSSIMNVADYIRHYIDWEIEPYKEYLEELKRKRDDMLLECRSAKNVVVYGAGKAGRYFLNRYGRECSHIAGFAVSNMQGVKDKHIAGYEIREIGDYDRDVTIIVAVGKRYAEDMLRHLELLQFNSVRHIDYEDLMLLDAETDGI